MLVCKESVGASKPTRCSRKRWCGTALCVLGPSARWIWWEACAGETQLKRGGSDSRLVIRWGSCAGRSFCETVPRLAECLHAEHVLLCELFRQRHHLRSEHVCLVYCYENDNE